MFNGITNFLFGNANNSATNPNGCHDSVESKMEKRSRQVYELCNENQPPKKQGGLEKRARYIVVKKDPVPPVNQMPVYVFGHILQSVSVVDMVKNCSLVCKQWYVMLAKHPGISDKILYTECIVKASKAAHLITDPNIKAQSLQSIKLANTLIEKDGTINRIEYSKIRDKILSAFMEAEKRHELLEDEKLDSPIKKGRYYVKGEFIDIKEAEKKNDFQQVKQSVKNIIDSWDWWSGSWSDMQLEIQAEILFKIVKCEVKTDIQVAKQTYKLIPKPWSNDSRCSLFRLRALLEILVVEGKNDFCEAQEISDRIKDKAVYYDNRRNWEMAEHVRMHAKEALRWIAIAEIKSKIRGAMQKGDIEEAIQSANLFEEPWFKMESLMRIADAIYSSK